MVSSHGIATSYADEECTLSEWSPTGSSFTKRTELQRDYSEGDDGGSRDSVTHQHATMASTRNAADPPWFRLLSSKKRRNQRPHLSATQAGGVWRKEGGQRLEGLFRAVLLHKRHLNQVDHRGKVREGTTATTVTSRRKNKA